MNETCEIKNMLDVSSKVLLRCFILGMVFLVLWLVLLAFGADWVYTCHSRWFTFLSREQFDAIHYGGMAIFKMFVFSVFLIPYISIRLVSRRAF